MSPASSARSRRSAASRYSPKPTSSSRAPGFCSATSGQAASSRSTPLETISLPTKTTRAPGAAANHSTASGGRRALAPEARVPRRAQVRGQRAQARGCLGARQLREELGVDARRAEPRLRRQLGSATSPRGSRRCGASRRAPRTRPPSPRGRREGSAGWAAPCRTARCRGPWPRSSARRGRGSPGP